MDRPIMEPRLSDPLAFTLAGTLVKIDPLQRIVGSDRVRADEMFPDQLIPLRRHIAASRTAEDGMKVAQRDVACPLLKLAANGCVPLSWPAMSLGRRL
jgi:hypothetical protein